MKKILILLCVLIVFGAFSQRNVEAVNLNVECQSSSCAKTGEDPLFSKTLDGVWYPGRSLIKTISIKNSNTDSKNMHLRSSQASEESLKDVMNVEIYNGSSLIWNGTLKDFLGQKISLGTFSPGEIREYSFEMSMEEDADNLYQYSETTFNLTLGFRQEGSDENSGGGTSGTSNSPYGNSSNNQGLISTVLSSIVNTVSDSLSGEDLTSKEKPGPEKQVLGKENIFGSCSCSFWQFFAGILLVLLLLLLIYMVRKRIKHFFVFLRKN